MLGLFYDYQALSLSLSRLVSVLVSGYIVLECTSPSFFRGMCSVLIKPQTLSRMVVVRQSHDALIVIMGGLAR